jgi:hypothetical protein
MKKIVFLVTTLAIAGLTSCDRIPEERNESCTLSNVTCQWGPGKYGSPSYTVYADCKEDVIGLVLRHVPVTSDPMEQDRATCLASLFSKQYAVTLIGQLHFVDDKPAEVRRIYYRSK